MEVKLLVVLICFCVINGGNTYKEYESAVTGQYYLSESKVSYYEALQICREKNMQLVSIETRKKNKDLFRLVNDFNEAFWTSGNKIPKDNTWYWLKGERIEFFNWRKNEPNNLRTDESCVEVFRANDQLEWNDQPCQDERRFICERLPDEVLFPECVQYDEDLVNGSTIPQKRYYLGKEIVTFSKAAQMCQSMCMNLVTIESDKKNKDLYEAFASAGAKEIFWSSGHLKPDNVWQWLDGQNARFFSWNSPTEPNNARGNEYCVEILQKNGKIIWNDQPCEDRRMYVCESVDGQVITV